MKLALRDLKGHWRRRFGHRKCLYQMLSPFLPEVLCIDVGASYFPHQPWRVFLESARSRWIAVEPNEANLGYLKEWRYACQVSACTTGLSRLGGPHNFHVTNVDSGSSLLEPIISESIEHRIYDRDYFFPVQKIEIDTTTLASVINSQSSVAPVVVKLDTQGTELDILLGAKSCLESHQVVGIEMESTLLAEPFYKGSKKFWEASRDLEEFGYELLRIDPIVLDSKYGPNRTRGRRALCECDAIFTLRCDIAQRLPVEHRMALAGFYATNQFYEEVLTMIEKDAELVAAFRANGANIDVLTDQLQKLL